MFQILVAEDNTNTRKLLVSLLKRNGYETIEAVDGIDALEKLDNHHADLIVLDVMMPRMDGYTFTEELRASGSTVPILMLTARQLVDDRRKGFLSGTDDYLTKPFDNEELLLRIKALLRRAHAANEKRITVGNLVLDYDSCSLTYKGQSESLPQKEFYLLYKLASTPQTIFTRLQLMDEIWGMDSESTDSTINVHINRLRKRLENIPEIELITVRGLGYKAVLHE
ncbi:MAG: response regulator transcription factor [Erysipelotrichaceae bacterium]|nr:response regulator transcription factor [Erysipelotrichaceae bacterium]